MFMYLNSQWTQPFPRLRRARSTTGGDYTMFKKTLIGLMAASAATLALSAPASAADEGGWSLTSKVEPGGRIDADVYTGLGHSACTPTGPVISAGFTAPIRMVGMGNWGHMGGS